MRRKMKQQECTTNLNNVALKRVNYKAQRQPYSLFPIMIVAISMALTVLPLTYGQSCNNAPTAEMRRLCRMMRRMDRVSRTRAAQNAEQIAVSRNSIEVQPPAPPPSVLEPMPVPWNARGQFASDPYDCMTLTCLCPFFRGQIRQNRCFLQNGEQLRMAYRKEYRMLTENERQRYHNALNQLKRSGIYDSLSAQHQIVGTGSGAHSGPGFLTWHREYLKRVEIAIRLIDPGLALPYWDSVIDGYLPDPRDSMLHTSFFIGEPDFNGFILSGPFAYWRTLEGRPYILRQLGQEGHLFTEQEVNSVMQQNNIEYILAYTVPLPSCPYPINFQAIEYTHSNIHLWLGGDMKPPITSANDPIFYMHHTFVDLIWENWRQLRQPYFQREYAYSVDSQVCANPLHFSYAQMRPFNLLNRDGLSNLYTEQMYRYAPRPSCSAASPNCGSPWLFCDLNHGYPHCIAKIKPNGLCSGFEGTDACYNGICYFGRCYPNPRAQGTRARQFASAGNANATIDTTRLGRLVPLNDCYNRHPCCERWAKNGECKKNKQYMEGNCAAACNVCTPTYDIKNECADRHDTCAYWAKNNECNKRGAAGFMRENCRKSCGLCKIKKCTAQPSKSNGGNNRTMLTPPPKKPTMASNSFRKRA